jgi:neutral ceramidase
MATHTHSGMAGHNESPVLSYLSGGFDQVYFDKVVSGIVQSIELAKQNRRQGSIYLTQGQLEGASRNRSIEAYLKNSQAQERKSSVDETMTLLKFVHDSGEEVGILNWFAVHATSMSNENRLVSADNKGLAAVFFEKTKNALRSGRGNYVAAFANSAEGDVSPVPVNSSDQMTDIERTRQNAELQFRKALELSELATDRVQGSLDYSLSWVSMSDYVVEDSFTSAGRKKLCKGALGWSVLAGTSDGRSNLSGIREGMKQDDNLGLPIMWSLLGGVLNKVLFGANFEDNDCHYPKPIALATGLRNWTSQRLPFQLVKLGQLVIVAVPSEMTTVAGSTLLDTVTSVLGKDKVLHAVIAGLANDYSHYVATKAEYDMQHYEGANTLFGPYTLAGYQQIFSDLALELLSKSSHQYQSPENSDDPHQENSLETQDSFSPASLPVCSDNEKYLFDHGHLFYDQPQKIYAHGETMRVNIATRAPSRNILDLYSVFEVQYKTKRGWTSVAYDWDPETLLDWSIDRTVATVSWRIPEGVSRGKFRVRYHLGVGNGGAGSPVGPCIYSVVSQKFQVR